MELKKQVAWIVSMVMLFLGIVMTFMISALTFLGIPVFIGGLVGSGILLKDYEDPTTKW